MPSSTTNTVIINGGAAFVARCMTVLMSFITIRYAIHSLGIRGYGVWEVLFAVSIVSGALLGPLSGGLLWQMSRAHGTFNFSEVHRLIRIGVGAVFGILGATVPSIYFLRETLVHILNIPDSFATEATQVLTPLCALLVLSGLCDILAAAVSASQRAGLANLIQSFGLVINGLTMIEALHRGWRLYSFIIGQAIGFATTMIALLIIVVYTYGRFLPTPILPRKADIRVLSPYCGFLLIGSISIALRGQTDKLLLSAFGGSLWVGHYGIAIRLASPILMVCGFFYIPLIAASAALHANNDILGIHKLCGTMTSLIAFSAGAMVVLIASLYNTFIVAWLGRPVSGIAVLLYLLLGANLIAVLLTGVGSSLCKGLGRPGIEASYILLAIILNIAMKFVFIPKFGPIGTVVASAVSWSVASVVFAIVFHTTLKMPWPPTIRAAVSFFSVIATFFATCAFKSGAIKNLHFASSGTTALLVGAFSLSLYTVLSFAIWKVPLRPMFRNIFQNAFS